jgi:hypothetical protein
MYHCDVETIADHLRKYEALFTRKSASPPGHAHRIRANSRTARFHENSFACLMNARSLAPEDEDDRTRFRRDPGQGSPEGRRDRTHESVLVFLFNHPSQQS